MKLIIFDCDGTIVDSQHAIFESMRRAFNSEGLKAPPREAVLRVVGLSLYKAVARLLPEPDDALTRSLADAYKNGFRELRKDPAHNEPLYPGAREEIARLSAREDCLLGIATGKSRRGVDALLERENLSTHFVTIQTADNHPSKPHPSMIETAQAEAGCEDGATVMIGDTTFDIEMAVAAGVRSIGVTWGYHDHHELSDVGATAIANDYPHLSEQLDEFLGLQGSVA